MWKICPGGAGPAFQRGEDRGIFPRGNLRGGRAGGNVPCRDGMPNVEKGVSAVFERKKPVGKVVALPVSQIEPSPFQARRTFDEAELAGLAASIRENGLLQPVTVRRLGPDRYELVAGERRLRASRMAARVSTVSPDWEITRARVLSVTMGSQ